MDAWIVWLILAIVMIVIEVASQWLWTLCMALGFVAAMVMELCGAVLTAQIVAIPVVAIVAYFALMPLARKWYAASWRHHSHADRTGMDALLGRRAVVTREIRPGHLGYARIDGDFWQVKAPDVTEVVPVGTFMVVTAYDSIILTVQPIENSK